MITAHEINEQRAAKAFSKQSVNFDRIYGNDPITQYKRDRVRNHVSRLILSHSSILELNAGTGEDAIWFAAQGHRVHATDIANGMLEILTAKASATGLRDKITSEACSFTNLERLNKNEKYDLIFSNFGGLNCTGELDKVLSSFNSLLKPAGVVTLVVMPKFCLWETLLLFKGKFKTAFRRFNSKGGRTARVEDEFFKCWYYNPSYIKKLLNKDFDLIRLEGLCSLVPPSYLEKFSQKYSSLFRFLKYRETSLKETWPWNRIGDYYIISLRKRSMNA